MLRSIFGLVRARTVKIETHSLCPIIEHVYEYRSLVSTKKRDKIKFHIHFNKSFIALNIIKE
jgi:hypothetical protein